MRSQIDPIDLAALIVIPFAGAIALGTITLSVNVFGGFDFASAAFSMGGTSISWAGLLTIAAVGWIVATNEMDGSNYEQWEYGVIVLAFAIVPLYVLVPSVASFVDSNGIVSLGLVIVQSGAAVLVSYVE